MSGRQAKVLRKEMRRMGAKTDGPLAMRVRNTPAGSVRIEYSRPVATVTLTPDEARALAEAILKHVAEAQV